MASRSEYAHPFLAHRGTGYPLAMSAARGPRKSGVGAESPPTGLLPLARALRPLLRDLDTLLAGWHARAACIPDPELRAQAEASLTRKRFHCEGGGVYALAAGAAAPSAARFIVALQTISDYLDNLCDRSPAGGEADMQLLHSAMGEAVDPGRGGGPPERFYRLHPHRDDGGYLDSLVRACRTEVAALPEPGRAAFIAEASVLLGWYSELQAYKHLPAGREAAVRRWAEDLADHAPGLSWYEVAAAAGSTLGVFALFAQAAAGGLDPGLAPRIRRAYFPWVTGLHILLDYWIDRAEDRRGGDMNFTFYYRGAAEAAARLRAFSGRALASVGDLPAAAFHRTVVSGLPALYLADPKVARQGLVGDAWRVLRAAGPSTWFLYWAVRLLRAQGALRPAAP